MPWDGSSGGVAAQGKLRARRGLSTGVEEGNVIENEGGGGGGGGGGKPFYKSSWAWKGPSGSRRAAGNEFHY